MNNYHVRVSVDTQARVFNFTSIIGNISLVENTLKNVVKENYTVKVSKGYKRHRGKAVTFEEVILLVKALRFTKKIHTIEDTTSTEWKKLFSFYMPHCGIYQSTKYWGTFFAFIPEERSYLRPDESKLIKLFWENGLDWCVATSGNNYTHNRIMFLVDDGMITVNKEVIQHTLKKVSKTIIL